MDSAEAPSKDPSSLLLDLRSIQDHLLQSNYGAQARTPQSILNMLCQRRSELFMSKVAKEKLEIQSSVVKSLKAELEARDIECSLLKQTVEQHHGLIQAQVFMQLELEIKNWMEMS